MDILRPIRTTYQLGSRVDAVNAAMAQVPDDATVQATLGLLAPLAVRTDTFWIGNPATRYIVFDGLNSGYTPVPANVPAFIAQLFPGPATSRSSSATTFTSSAAVSPPSGSVFSLSRLPPASETLTLHTR